jgi:BirA family biotin operon repressor/biotin-[acetyl-CoA-carboxylase] ligase
MRAAAAAGAAHGTFVVTDVQTAGRGRLGRSWEAPPGANVCLSMVVRAGLPPGRLPLVCLLAAVAVAEVAGPSYGIKWPNDVLAVDGRKVAGILAEVEGDALVVGIGVNVRAAPPLSTATLLGPGHDRSMLVAGIVRGLLDGIPTLARDPAPLLARWRERAQTLGRRVRIGAIEGTAEDIDPSGALLVRTDLGIRKVLAGDVEMIGGP